ncbi:hypothetical protein FB567DRAFT_529772 [Paraphoma chrysanthemicola]|uniref:PAT1 multi-domain protein n=1 Tax=Paraphoma chrysanthemicola TaxID=798071 RepID=A0A8K0R242_9PLEO|nr:hypothetical protein FB567DRAFT_529772 [Paraphoma chrysanthemicola]
MPNNGQPGHAHKQGGGAFGQMMNQAVTTGKPMLNKLGKTISSKLGGKPPAGGPPQHLQSYQNYQDHNQPPVFQQQSQNQNYSPQAQQRPWQPPQQPSQPSQPSQPPPPNAYTPPQQSPFQQTSNYATPASGHSGQSNYFPAQNAQQQNTQAPHAPFNQGGVAGTEQQQQQYGQQGGQPYGQYQQDQPQGPYMGQHQGQPQGQFQQDHQPQGQYMGQQQTGVAAGVPAPGYPQQTPGPQIGDVSPIIPPNKPVAQPQWGASPGSEQPPAGAHQPYQTVPSPPIQPNQQQQWTPMSPVSPHGHPAIPPASASPPPTQQAYMQPQAPHNITPQTTQPPTPAPQHAAPPSAPTEFIAELPADMGNLNLGDAKQQGTVTSAHNGQYQAYQPPGSQSGSPSNRFSVPRRALSTSSLPLADPWRFADPVTEQPTREFYILADLIFDSLDRNVEPKNSGLLEGPKILASWFESTDDARALFSYNGYTAFARMWSLEGIPHVMVPVQPALAPVWNFSQHSHAQDLKVIAEPPTATSTYATYMPALNRAGWYKFFFLEMMHGPEDIGKLLSTLCADTYKPGVLNHPDLNKRDQANPPALHARAAETQTYAIRRVCEETRTAMSLDPNVPASSSTAQTTSSIQPGSPEDVALRMHKIQMERQFNDMAVKTVLGGGITFGPMGGSYGGYGSLV